MYTRLFIKLVKHFSSTNVLLQTLLMFSVVFLYVETVAVMSAESQTNAHSELQQPHVEKHYEMFVEELTPSADDNHAPLLVSVKETVELYLPFHKDERKNAHSYEQEKVKNTCIRAETKNNEKTESTNASTCWSENDVDDLQEKNNNDDLDDELFTYPAGVELVWLYLTKRHNLDELEWSGCGGKWRPEWSIPFLHPHSPEELYANDDVSNDRNNNKNVRSIMSYFASSKPIVHTIIEQNRTNKENNNFAQIEKLHEEKIEVLTERQEQHKSGATEIKESQYTNNEISSDHVADDVNSKLAQLRHYLSHHVVCSHSAVSMCVSSKKEQQSCKKEYSKQTRPEENSRPRDNNYYKNKMHSIRSFLSSSIFRHVVTEKQAKNVSNEANIDKNKNSKLNVKEELKEYDWNVWQKENSTNAERQQAAKEFQWVAQFVSSLTSSPLSWTKDTPRHIRPSGLLFSFPETLEQSYKEKKRESEQVCNKKQVTESCESRQCNHSVNEDSITDKENEEKTLHSHIHDRDYSYSHHNKEFSATGHRSWCSYHLVSHDTLCTQHISHWLNAGRSSHSIEQVIPNSFFNSLIGSFYIYLDSPFHHFSFTLRRSTSALEANTKWTKKGKRGIEERNEENFMSMSELDNHHPSRVIVAETRMSFVTDDKAHLRTLEMLWNLEATINNLNNKEFSLYSKVQSSNRTNMVRRLLASARNTNSQLTRPSLTSNKKVYSKPNVSVFSCLLEEEEFALSRQLILPELSSKLHTRGHDYGNYEIYLQPHIINLLDIALDIATLQKLIETANATVRDYLNENSTITTLLMFPLHLIRPTLFSMQSFHNTTTINYAHVDVDTNTLTIVLSTNLTLAHIKTYISHYTSLLERMLQQRCALLCDYENCDNKICNSTHINHNTSNTSNTNHSDIKIKKLKSELYAPYEFNDNHGVLLAHFDITHGWAGLKEMPRDANSYRVLPQPTAVLTREINCKRNIRTTTTTTTIREQQEKQHHEEKTTEKAKLFEPESLPSLEFNSRTNHINHQDSLERCLELCKECDNSNVNSDHIDHAHAIAALMYGLRRSSTHSSKEGDVNKYNETSVQDSRKSKTSIAVDEPNENNSVSSKELYSEEMMLTNSDIQLSCLCSTWLRAREVSGSTIPTPDPAMVFNVVALWSTILTITAASIIRIAYKLALSV